MTDEDESGSNAVTAALTTGSLFAFGFFMLIISQPLGVALMGGSFPAGVGVYAGVHENIR